MVQTRKRDSGEGKTGLPVEVKMTTVISTCQLKLLDIHSSVIKHQSQKQRKRAYLLLCGTLLQLIT
jgi:hypothetical protein